MADNIAITAGSGTSIAADDIGAGLLVQRVKTTWGPDGTANDADVATGKPLPVQLRSPTGTDLIGTAGTASAAVITVQGIASGTAQPVSIASVPSHAVTNAGTFVVQENGAALTSLQLIDDAIFAEDVASANGDKGVQILTRRTDTAAASSGTDGDYQPLITDGSGRLHVQVNTAQIPTAGAAASSASVPMVIANDQKFFANAYETVAASQTAQVIGATGGTGDWISGILVIPATTSPGNVLLLDNATSITIFTGGASSVSNLVPFFIPLGMVSVSGAWKITTGANVSCIGIGKFA